VKHWLDIKKKLLTPEATQLDKLRDIMGRDPKDHDLARLYPQIMPLALVTRDWPGPIEQLGDLPFGISWAIADPQNFFRYVDWGMVRSWEHMGISWKALAMENLTELAYRDPCAGSREDAEGRPFILSLLTSGGMGPSRLLVPGLFTELFGDDYTVAIPEQTCAVVFRNGLEGEEAFIADAVIDGCFKDGTQPMSNERFEPPRFWNF